VGFSKTSLATLLVNSSILSIKFNVEQALSLQTPSLAAVLNRFPVLREHVSLQDVDKEWRNLALLDLTKFGLDELKKKTYQFWLKVMELKTNDDDFMFSSLRTVVKLLLVLPFSNASVERLFSHVKLCKTPHRNKLATETVTALMHTKQAMNKCCVKFEPSVQMLKDNIWLGRKHSKDDEKIEK